MPIEILREAFLPVFTMLAIGYVSRRLDLLSGAFWTGAEKLTYYILFPFLLVHSLGTAELGTIDLTAIAVTGLLPLAAGGGAIYAMRRRYPDGPAFTSVFQAGIRFNTYIAFALTAALYGTDGLSVAAALVGVIIPAINALLVINFSLTLSRSESLAARLFDVVRELLKNPLFMACVIGAALNATGIGLPYSLDQVTQTIGRAALPLGVMAVGAGLAIAGLKKSDLKPVLFTAAVKFLLLPVVAAVTGTLFGLDPAAVAVCVLVFSMPTATSAYILARQMGGDAPLMASLIAWHTSIALIWLPLVAYLLALLISAPVTG